MKKLGYIILCLIIFQGCDPESSWDCIQQSGGLLIQRYDVPEFSRILVERDVELIVQEGPDFEVAVQSGENLLPDIEVKVVGNQLQITDNNTCNLLREYGITKAFVTAPNITEIRNSSQYEVSSANTLTYPDLVLISEDFNESDSFTVGDFRLYINNESIQIISNNISFFYLSGTTEDLNVGFFAGSGRFEGADLVAENVQIFHRGSNDMIVNPQQSLVGELRGTGDLISVNTPPVINVEQFYTGQLILED